MNLRAVGKIFLVGAGPGDPELLTLKAARALREADVVLHDDLVSCEILEIIPRTAIVMSVGKRCGNARITQEEINDLMISYATSGRTVVRLKSGDPTLFGRVGEEIDALRAAGVDFEVVPGISTAFAAAAALQASLTDRRTASRVVFSTGHRALGASSEGTTHVIYMPGSDFGLLAHKLIEEGLAPKTACAVVSAVSLEAQSVLRTTLAELPNLGPTPSPAILVVGDVLTGSGESGCGLRDELLSRFVSARN